MYLSYPRLDVAESRVRVPSFYALDASRGVTGHSDADVVLHSLVDAILGALSDGDIGVHFPPSDPQWRGALFRVRRGDREYDGGQRRRRIGSARLHLEDAAVEVDAQEHASLRDGQAFNRAFGQ